MASGWDCPKCGSVYAPWVASCTKCAPVPAPMPTLPAPMPSWQPPPGPPWDTIITCESIPRDTVVVTNVKPPHDPGGFETFALTAHLG